MNTTPLPHPPEGPAGTPSTPGSQRPQRPPIVWQAVLGLGALVLLWPLTSLTGIAGAIGGPARAAFMLTVIGAAWIGVVGIGRLPRPVLTLTLTGMAGGGYLLVADLLVGAGTAGGLGALAWPFLLLDLVGGGALWGVLAGLLAAGVQRLLGRR